MNGPERRRFGLVAMRRGGLAAPLLIVAVLLASALIAVHPQTPSDYFNEYSRVAGLLAQGDSQACAAAQQLRDKAPAQFGAYNLLAICASQQGRLSEAEKLLRKCLDLNPSFTPARNNLAVNLLQQRKVKEALTEFQTVLASEPGDVTALVNVGKIELSQGRTKEAIPHLEKAQALRPDDPEIALTLAAALSAVGWRAKAASLSTEVIEGSQEPTVLIAAGMLAVKNGAASAARQAFAKSIRISKTSEQLILQSAERASQEQQFELARALCASLEDRYAGSADWNALHGYALFKTGSPEEALQYLQKAIEINPLSEDYYMKLGELMTAHHSDRAAAAVFETGLKNLPESHLLHLGLAVAYLTGSREWEQAHEHLYRALELQPRFEPALDLLCHAALFRKEWSRLQQQADRLLGINPKSFKGHYYKALALQGLAIQNREEASFQGALSHFDKSLEINGDFVEALIEKGKLLNRMENWNMAISAFEKAAAMNPESEEAFLHLARLYKRTGQEDKSRQASREHARLNQLKRDETEKPRGLFQVQE